MRFESIDEIRRFFNVHGSSDKVRRELRERQVAIHPDQNAGAFRSETEEAEFHRLGEAINAIDAGIPESSNALVTVSAVGDIISLVYDSVRESQVSNIDLLHNETERRVTEYRQSHLLPKISLPSISAVLTFLWAFPNLVAENSAFSGILAPSTWGFQILWAGALSITASVWFVLWRTELRQAQFQRRVTTERFQNDEMMEFLWAQGNIETDGSTFTKAHFAEWLVQKYGVWHYKPLWPFTKPPLMDPELAEVVANVAFDRALSNGFLQKDPSPSMSGLYRIAPGVTI